MTSLRFFLFLSSDSCTNGHLRELLCRAYEREKARESEKEGRGNSRAQRGAPAFPSPKAPAPFSPFAPSELGRLRRVAVTLSEGGGEREETWEGGGGAEGKSARLALRPWLERAAAAAAAGQEVTYPRGACGGSGARGEGSEPVAFAESPPPHFPPAPLLLATSAAPCLAGVRWKEAADYK